MQTFTISQNGLHNLIAQLQIPANGLTIKEIRLLDAILTNLENLTKNYTDQMDAIVDAGKTEVAQNPSAATSISDRINGQLEDLALNGFGKEPVKIALEDNQMEYVKGLWAATQGFKGDKTSRKIIIEIDDAITGAQAV